MSMNLTFGSPSEFLRDLNAEVSDRLRMVNAVQVEFKCGEGVTEFGRPELYIRVANQDESEEYKLIWDGWKDGRNVWKSVGERDWYGTEETETQRPREP